MITINQQTISLSGHLSMDNVPSIYTQGLHVVTVASCLVDCAQLESVDSSAIALLFAWQRAAQANNCPLRVSGLPSSLLSLASLYGVGEMLPNQVAV